MTNTLIVQHLVRAWKRHWVLQLASITVMTLVLVLVNFLFLGFSAFEKTIDSWGQGLEMIVYLKEETSPSQVEELHHFLNQAQVFSDIKFTSKSAATEKFLTALGDDSLELLSDPKWKSPIPASFEIRLSPSLGGADTRLQNLETWNAKLKVFSFVEDVFYGQGWVENFAKFVASAKGFMLIIWIVSLAIGLLIVSNCIRLSFFQRKEEIEVLELVGATRRFIRTPFLLEGLVLGLTASTASIFLSYSLHLILLDWLGSTLGFWVALSQLSPLEPWALIANLGLGVLFGTLGAWNCLRKMNTGWSASSSRT